MSQQPQFTLDGDQLLVTLPADYDRPYRELSREAKKYHQKIPIDWSGLKEAYKYGRGRPFPVGTTRDDFATCEKLKVRFSPDGLTAYIRLYPPKPRGRRLNENEVLALLEAYGIPRERLDMRELRTGLLRRDYEDLQPVAYGEAPENGEDIKIRWTATPTDPAGFMQAARNTESFPSKVITLAEPAQPVGYRSLPKAGRQGTTVLGAPIPPSEPKDAYLIGEGLELSPKGDAVLAASRGQLRLEGPGGAYSRMAPATELDDPEELHHLLEGGSFAGSLIFNGDLEVNFPVHIMCDLEVRGALIGTPVEVAGSLIVRDGISQTGPKPIIVGGVASASFYEYADVRAHTIHVRKYSLHSTLSAISSILGTPRSSIQGGEAEAGRVIDIATLGAASMLATRVAIGNRQFSAFHAATKNWLEEMGARVRLEGEPRPLIAERMKRLGELAEFAFAPPDLSNCFIRSRALHPGVEIIIGNASREFSEQMGQVTFSWEKIGSKDRVALDRG